MPRLLYEYELLGEQLPNKTDLLINLKTRLIEKIKAETREPAIRALEIEEAESVLKRLIESARATAKARAEYEADNELTDSRANNKTDWNIAVKWEELKEKLEGLSIGEITLAKINANEGSLFRLLKEYRLEEMSTLTDWVMPKKSNLDKCKYTLTKDQRAAIKTQKIATKNFIDSLTTVAPFWEVFNLGMKYKQEKMSGGMRRDFNLLNGKLQCYLKESYSYLDAADSVVIKNTGGNSNNLNEVLVAEALIVWCEKSGIPVAAGSGSPYPRILRAFLDVAGRGDEDWTRLAAKAMEWHEAFKKIA